uniref:CPG4 domain-containing protein n=2 Tax=Strongyloides stercoralis TaxID=6248 RepID=A0A0K0E116_STRER
MLYIIFINYKKFIFIILGILLIFKVQKIDTNLYKLKKCEMSMKKTLSSILQNTEEKNSLLLTPFHETIAKFKNDSEAYQRIIWGCFSIFRFEKCLSILEDSHLKNIKLASIKHWKEICSYARERKEDFYDFLNCERKHIFKAKSLCTMPTRNPNKTTLEMFCEDLYEYNKCYRSIDKKCGESALELAYILDEVVIESYINVVKLATHIIKIPGTCNWIMKPNIKEISKNKYKESRESKKYEKEVSTSFYKKNITNLNLLTKKNDIESDMISLSGNNGHHHTAKNHNLPSTTFQTNIYDDENEYKHDSFVENFETTDNQNEIFTDSYENNDGLFLENNSMIKANENLSTTKQSYNTIYHYDSNLKINSSDIMGQTKNTSTKNSLTSFFGLIKNKSNYICINYQHILLAIIVLI